MLELNSIYPDEEELKEAFNREMATLQESVQNLTELFKRMLSKNTYVTDQFVADLLHVSIDNIPVKIPKYKVSKTTVNYLYKLSEVEKFIESKRTVRERS